MNENPSPKDYSDVRHALRERGYLETPLERVFLGAGAPRGGDGVTYLRLAGLTGVLAGIPLGLLLAAALLIESRGVIPIWPDGVLYAVLFMPVMAGLVALAEFAVALAVRALARWRGDISPRRAALGSGMGVAVLLALYLGLWWAASRSEFALSQLLGLLGLALAAGLTGRVVSAAILIQAALTAGRAPRLKRPPMGKLLLGGAAIISLLTALGAWAYHNRTGESAPVVVAADSPQRLVLVGWDGLDQALVRGLIERGETPWLAELTRGGQSATVVVEGAGDPVAEWTTVATGCDPTTHGVGGAGLVGLPGTAAPALPRGLAAGPVELLTKLLPTRVRVVRSGLRRVPALWEITAQARKTAVVNWWGTWPAHTPGPEGGYLVSDGAFVAARESRGLEEAIFPPAWGRDRAAAWLAEARERARSAGPEAPLDRMALTADLFALESLAGALEDPGVGAALVYLPGLDILRERSRASGRDPFRTLEAVSRHAAAIDLRLREILGPARPNQRIALAALPGRNPGTGRGLFVVAPPAAKRRAEGSAAPPPSLVALTPAEIGPTWLSLGGFPVDSRMKGSPLGAMVPDGARLRKKVRTPARPAAGGKTDPELEREVLERLRSLGYVD